MTTHVMISSPRFWVSSSVVCFAISLPGHSVAAPSATATEKTDTATSQTLIVSAPRAGLTELGTPAALSVLTGEDFRQAKPQINLSESMGSVPGLQIQNRQNYAQDLQLSVRGFGARSMYGVRGVRIYVDGIPATMPDDGQGQTSNIDLNSVDKVEVLRGPFSALYGNASGGVVNVDTVTGSQPDKLEAGLYAGSYGSWRYGVKATGAVGDGSHAGDVNYAVSTTRFTTHGYRDHSDARKNLGNAKLGVRIDDVSTLTLLFNAVDITANDPGGLTNDQWHDNPRQATRAEQFNTRKTLTQTQVGLHYLRQMSDDDDLSVMMYAGERDTTQYQAIPVATQANPLHAGGVIDLTRHYQGIDTRWTHRGALGAIPLTLTGGLDYETMTEQRKGYENYTLNNGVTELGTQGALRRNERNLMWNLDPYLQSAWELTSRLTFNAGVRFSHVQFDSNDHYITAENGDDSGDASYHRWLPVGSLRYAVTEGWNVYLSAGRGFETPTINELSYRPDGLPGLNYALKPSTSNTVEIGSKTRIGSGLASVALFQTDTDNEIVVADSSNGRTSYTNAGKTRRRGLELSLDQQFAEDIQLRLAWTLLDATYRTRACGSSDCSDGDAIAAGNRLPGIARNMGYASLAWSPPEGWYAGAEIRYMSDIEVDDENSQQAPAYTVAALNTGYRYVLGNWLMDVYGRVDNLFDRRYAGSVIVNESNAAILSPRRAETGAAACRWPIPSNKIPITTLGDPRRRPLPAGETRRASSLHARCSSALRHPN